VLAPAPLVLQLYAAPLRLPAYPSAAPSSSAAIAAAAAAGMYGMGGGYAPYAYAPVPMHLPAPLPVAAGLSAASHPLSGAPVGLAPPTAVAPTAVAVPGVVGGHVGVHWAPVASPPTPSAAATAAPAGPAVGSVSPATRPTPPPKRKITRTRRRKSSPPPPADLALDELARANLAGTTAARSRKMSASEREVMLHRRRLRNRASAARSRYKAREAAARGISVSATRTAADAQAPDAMTTATRPATAASAAAAPTLSSETADAAAAAAALASMPLASTHAHPGVVARGGPSPSLSPGDAVAKRLAEAIAYNVELRERNARLHAVIGSLQRASGATDADAAAGVAGTGAPVSTTVKTVFSPVSPVAPIAACGGDRGSVADPAADQSCGSLELDHCVRGDTAGGGRHAHTRVDAGVCSAEPCGGLSDGSGMSGLTLAGEAVQVLSSRMGSAVAEGRGMTGIET